MSESRAGIGGWGHDRGQETLSCWLSVYFRFLCVVDVTEWCNKVTFKGCLAEIYIQAGKLNSTNENFVLYPSTPPSWPGALFAVLGACNPLLRWVWATESAGCHPVSCSVLACTRGLERGCLRESFESARDFVCAACKTYTTPILQKLLANCTSAGHIFTHSRQRILSEALNMSMNVLSHLGRREFLQFLKSNWTFLSLWKAFYLYIKGQCSSKWCAGNSIASTVLVYWMLL